MKKCSILPPFIAHRGLSRRAPENTLAAFRAAHAAGARWIEFDVQLAACGTAIIMHDATLARTSNGQGTVASHPYTYLATLDAGSWFDVKFKDEKIPRFIDVLNLMRELQLCANIEIKPPAGAESITVKQVLADLRTWQAQGETPDIIISSFSLPVLLAVKALAPDLPLGGLFETVPADWQGLCQTLNCVSLHMRADKLTAENIATFLSEERLLLAYTVNEVAEAKKLLALGVDAVFTDCVDRML